MASKLLNKCGTKVPEETLKNIILYINESKHCVNFFDKTDVVAICCLFQTTCQLRSISR